MINEEYENSYHKGYNDAMRDFRKKPNRNIKEIEEVINCDADAENKLKMITNIIHSKPHYFKELDEESFDELDFVQPHKKIPVNLNVCKMREATQEEREGIERYIDSIAEPCDDVIPNS